MPKRLAAVEVRRGSVVPDVGNERALLFDRSPLTAGVDKQERGGFRFTGRSVTPVGRPTITGFQEALALACEFHESSPYWIGALVAYGESRADWKEKLSQAMSVTKLARKTLLNLGYLYRESTPETRAAAPTPGHLDAVVKLPTPDQVVLLDRARREEMTVHELRLEVQLSKRRKVLEGRAVLEGLYRVLYVDYPWPSYKDRPPSGRGAAENYPTLPIAEGMALPVAAHCTKDAAMGFWVPAPLLYYAEDGGVPDALKIIRAWDFTPKAQIIWNKVTHGFGHYVSVRHEILFLCTRGRCTPDRPTPMLDSVVDERPPSDEHSAKPETFRKILERLWDGPYLELFGTRPVENWTVYGNDARLWGTRVEQPA